MEHYEARVGDFDIEMILSEKDGILSIKNYMVDVMFVDCEFYDNFRTMSADLAANVGHAVAFEALSVFGIPHNHPLWSLNEHGQ